MGEKLRLTVACGDYEIVRALKERTVKADGLNLTLLTGMGSREFISRMIRRLEFDVAEIGVTSYINLRQQGAPLTAIPVFPHRRFRHGFVFVNSAAGIKTPKDILGKKVGGYIDAPSNVWIRGILDEHHGVPYGEVEWIGESREAPPSLENMLIEGRLAALVSPSVPSAIVNGDARIAYLFPNYKDVEIEYFRKTKIFPIMHLIAVKQEIVDKYPWVASNLVAAFEESKKVAYRRLLNPRIVPLAWHTWEHQEQRRILGPDPWMYGLGTANCNNLDTLQRYMVKQGLSERVIPTDELFAKTDPPNMFGHVDDELRL